MTIRTHKKIVTFKKPFLLEYNGSTLPAGKYVIVTEEEILEGLSFCAYRQLQTYIYRQTGADQKGLSQLQVVDPDELDDAIERDGATPIGDVEVDRGYKATALTSESDDKVANHEAMDRASDDGMPCRSHLHFN